jgi:alanine racemase
MRLKSKVVIHFERLRSNLKKIKKIAPDNKIIFMVKANGYGHGLVPIVKFSVEQLKIKEFGVATLGEAMVLRDQLSDLEFDIFVFSDVDIQEGYLAKYLDLRLLPVLSSWEDFELVVKDPSAKHLPLTIKLDTGMNRLGLDLEEETNYQKFIHLLKSNQRLRIHHLMTHFSCSSLNLKTNNRTERQYERFCMIEKKLQNDGVKIENTSVANSGAIEQKFGLQASHIRPGLMMYGPSSLIPALRNSQNWDGENLSDLTTNIVNVKKVKKGAVVGYGAHVLASDGILVHIALGYGDGLVTWYTGVNMTQKGFTGQFVGRINMDLAAILFPIEAEDVFKVGDPFTIWGKESESVTRISDQMNTIPYQLFCSLSSRLPREYRL